MSGATKTLRLSLIALLGGAMGATTLIPSVRDYLHKHVGTYIPKGTWQLLLFLLALLNLKNLPFMWHVRVFRAFTYQLYTQPRDLPPHALFQYHIVTSRTPLSECDYNGHKSNSTYFSDLDVARAHLVSAILKKAIRKLNQRRDTAVRATDSTKVLEGDGAMASRQPVHNPRNQKFGIALGAVSCQFRREIPPYAKVEIWTKLLSWDRKWFYLVSHVVKPGVAKPPTYTLQPSKGRKRPHGDANGTATHTTAEEGEKFKSAIYATSIAKYVVKAGRITVPPQICLQNASMLPSGEVPAEFDTYPADAHHFERLVDTVMEQGEFTWAKIDEERRRGMELAENFAALDGLHDVFDGAPEGAMGVYKDNWI